MGTIKFSLKPGECKRIAGIRVCNRWKKNTTQAGKDYEKGIRNPKRSWGKESCNSADRYKKGVDKAHSRGAFKKGIKKTGSVGFRTKTLRKGPTRFAQGVAGAGDAYEQGFKPYHASFPSILMPQRFPKGDPRNIDRCKTVCSAMGQTKVGLAGTGKVTCPDR